MGNKNQETRDERLKFAFGSHSKVEVLHVTSDDQMFTDIANAKAHAKSLEDSEVQTVKRSDHIKSAKAEENPEDIKKKEREELFAEHEKLFGNLPKPNASTKNVKEKVEAEKARLIESSKKDAQATGGAQDPDPTGESDPAGGKGPEGDVDPEDKKEK